MRSAATSPTRRSQKRAPAQKTMPTTPVPISATTTRATRKASVGSARKARRKPPAPNGKPSVKTKRKTAWNRYESAGGFSK
jgi:hypothetical protein